MTVHVAVDAFYYDPGKGKPIYVRRGDTVEDGHPLLSAHPAAFRPQELTHSAPRVAEPAPKNPKSATI